eukprot:TRINITY_DN2964_c0_g2_i4.p1 TRINITY_DN2964_c0_g2~~TRINITY_DN2964_c0_g2_i4.p1  ORF type:complete len:203 (+),score=55.74 TRINITY_DN2964_c0_g2_i4:70-678(+)
MADDSISRCNYKISTVAYVKMLLHASKHLQVAVNGVLIGTKTANGVEIDDVVPLLHGNVGLTPYFEAGLMMVDAHLEGKKGKSQIVGMYYAHSTERHEDPCFFSTKLAVEKIKSQFDDACIIQLMDNKMNSLDKQAPLQVLVRVGKDWAVSETNQTTTQRLQQEGALKLLVEELSQLKHNRIYDFADHLEDCRRDFINQPIV